MLPKIVHQETLATRFGTDGPDSPPSRSHHHLPGCHGWSTRPLSEYSFPPPAPAQRRMPAAAAVLPPPPTAAPLPRPCAPWRPWSPSTSSAREEGSGWRLLRRGRGRRRSGGAMARPPILSVALPSDTGRVLSIQSHTVQGYVGNKSAVFPLQLLGFDVDPINSVQFSNHTGYPKFRGQVLNGNQLWDIIEGLEENELLHYTHLLTGYIGSVSFLNTVLQAVDKLRSVNPDLIYVCDPVLGDEGKLYVPQELISVYQQKVVPVASMLTPNQFEVELLTGLRIISEQDGLKACNTLHSAGPRKVIITSALIEDKLLLIGSYKKTEGPPEQFKIEIPKIPAYFTGTGDLTTALLLGWSNKYPDNLERAAELAVSSLQALLRKTVEDYKRAGFDPSTSSLEIRLIQSQDEIRSPQVTCNAVKYS